MTRGTDPINPVKYTGDHDQIGLTKREYLAGIFMQGLISKYNLKTSEDQQIISQLSVELADSLILELNK